MQDWIASGPMHFLQLVKTATELHLEGFVTIVVEQAVLGSFRKNSRADWEVVLKTV
jgi:hypothetical protein